MKNANAIRPKKMFTNHNSYMLQLNVINIQILELKDTNIQHIAQICSNKGMLYIPI